jgi:hypothetical protein
MRYLSILLLTIPFTQELQVEGNLKVTGSIDAQGNPITNVGSPIQSDDAVNMGFLQTEMTGLAGMKPERIYTKYHDTGDLFTYTVPNGKVWLVTARSQSHNSVYINSNYFPIMNPYDYPEEYKVWVLPNSVINCTSMDSWVQLTIFEYSISGSGSEQGLDYIEP